MHAGLAYDSVVFYRISIDPKSDGIFVVDSLRMYRILSVNTVLINIIIIYCIL